MGSGRQMGRRPFRPRPPHPDRAIPPEGTPLCPLRLPRPRRLARPSETRRPEVAERWEVYLGGLELANAYSELCDAAAQRARFEETADERRRLGKTAYPMDEDFLNALAEPGMPPSGGIALGVDRLIMLLCDLPDINDARLFCQRPGELL